MKTLITFTCGLFLFFQVSYAQDFKTYEIKAKVNSVTYEGTVFKPTKAKINYTLIISPNISGVTSLELTAAAYFAEQGYIVLVSHPFETELTAINPDTDKADNDYNKFAIASNGLLNVMEAQFNLPDNIPVFALGSSQGAISTIIITSQMPQIKAIWTAVGGGDLPYIYAHSLVSQIITFRTNHMRTLGIKDNNVYETYLRTHLKNDPAISCKSIAVPFHQTIALYDDMVPTRTQEYLVDECPEHQVKRLAVDHVVGAASVLSDREAIKEFFESSI